MEETKVTVEKKVGKIQYKDKTYDLPMTITKTEHSDGRVDCTIGLPRINLKSEKK